MRTWRARHPETALANSRKWTERNRQKTRDCAKAYYHAHKKQINKRRRAERKANPEKFRARDRKRKRRYNPESRKNHYEKNKKRLTREVMAYRRSHPEIQRTANSRRRARLLSGGRHTTAQWLEKLSKIGMKCVYCHKKLTFKTLTKDHVIPLSKGGTDDIENVVPSCLRCNQTKSAKLISVDRTSGLNQALYVRT